MDFSYIKFLLYCNKKDKVSRSELCNHFKLSNKEISKIFSYLKDNNYVIYVGDSYYSSTYRGKHFIQSAIFSFINVNIVDILALIVAIIALIFSIIAIFK